MFKNIFFQFMSYIEEHVLVPLVTTVGLPTATAYYISDLGLCIALGYASHTFLIWAMPQTDSYSVILVLFVVGALVLQWRWLIPLMRSPTPSQWKELRTWGGLSKIKNVIFVTGRWATKTIFYCSVIDAHTLFIEKVVCCRVDSFFSEYRVGDPIQGFEKEDIQV